MRSPPLRAVYLRLSATRRPTAASQGLEEAAPGSPGPRWALFALKEMGSFYVYSSPDRHAVQGSLPIKGM